MDGSCRHGRPRCRQYLRPCAVLNGSAVLNAGAVLNGGVPVLNGEGVWLIPLRDLDADAQAIQLNEVAQLQLSPGQERFVGDPLRMALAGLAEESRRPYVIESDGRAAGVLTLQRGAARLAGWPDDDSAWLLRGFLVDRRLQGRGIGRHAAIAAVLAAARLTARHRTGESGVVLSVNEANPAGLAAYSVAGFIDHGRYDGGPSGPQRTMFRGFPDATMR